SAHARAGGGKDARLPSAASGDDGAPSLAQLMAIEANIGAKLAAIEDQVARLGLADRIRAARDVQAQRVALLDDADAAARRRYLPVLQFQHAQLSAVGPRLAAVVQQYWPLRGIPAFALAPQRRVERAELETRLELYVRAAATSHDETTSAALVREVERWKERDQLDA